MGHKRFALGRQKMGMVAASKKEECGSVSDVRPEPKVCLFGEMSISESRLDWGFDINGPRY